MNVIIDERVNETIEKYFSKLGYEIIKVKKNNKLYSEISSHTDIQCIKIDDVLIYEKGCIDNNCNINMVENIGDFSNCFGIYNVCIIGNYAIHNFKKTDKKVLDLLKEYTLINVKQEYARCSILPLNNNSVITSDKGIYNTLLKHNFDVLYIEEKNIKLYNNNGTYSDMYGFIGGCSAIINNTVIFFGDIDKLNNKEKIVNFITNKGYKIKDFKNMDLIDYGSCNIIRGKNE